MTRTVAVLFLLIASGIVRANQGHAYALVINGLNQDPEDSVSKDRALQDLRHYLLATAKIDADRLTVLDGNEASARRAAEAMDHFATAAGAQDRFVFYYLGQANAVMGKLRLNLPGADITHEDVARRLSRIRARQQLIVLDCPCAALAVQALAGPGRVVVCATAETQVYSTRFSSHFVRALVQPHADTDWGKRVSVLEAFTTAARQIEQWYRDRQVLPTETPCLEDNGDGVPSERPWRHTVEAVDGRAASEFFLAED